MLIDFHAHVFPDKLATGAVASLAQKAGFTPFTGASFSEMEAFMKAQGVDKFVALNIAVSPKTEKSVNDFALSLLGRENVIPFGSVHPYSENAFAELDRLAEAGIKGIKFHNEYQNFFVDDEKALPVYKKCVQHGFVMLFHGGADRAFKPPVKTAPDRMRRVVDRFPCGKFVVAHLGGQDMTEEAVRCLSDTPAFIDISFGSRCVSAERMEEVVRAFGVERTLFGTDCPWDTPKNTLEWLSKTSFSKEELSRICHINAEKLLGLN